MENRIERIKTGIHGLDKLIAGGFIKGSTILVSGGAGTGKTIFCSQFIWEGLKNDENCLFITLEESPRDIELDALTLGWDFSSYIKNKKLILDYGDPFRITNITTELFEEIKSHKVKRVVIDSTSILGFYFNTPSEIRKQLFKLVTMLKKSGATSVITSEITDQNRLSRFGVEEFVVDGVIILDYLKYSRGSGISRSLEIKKMRRTKHGEGVYPLEITSKGIVVKTIR